MAAIRASIITLALVGASTLTLGSDQRLLAQSAGRTDPARCSALTGVKAAGLEITSAKVVPAAAPGTVVANPITGEKVAVALPEHCRVEGMLNRRKGVDNVEYGIGFALTLPANWNGRFLFNGGGGLNGSIGAPLGVTASGDSPALARGFAVIATDSGHKGAVFDAAFMKDQQASLDFAYNSVGKVTETGKALVAEFYGRPAERTYGAGCSTGGRENMLAAQSYPMMFDGVIVGAPAMMTGHSNLALLNAMVAFNQIAPKDAQGRPNPAQDFSPDGRKLLADAVADTCDALDGLKDGLIQNLNACRFDPVVLQCKGKKGASCLSSAQVKALRTAFAGPRDKNGEEVYVRFPYDLGLVGGPSSNAISFLPGGAPSPVGPPSLALQIDVDEELARVRADDMQNMTDTAFWTNLSTFYGHGGKVIFFHGASDPWFSTFATQDYEQRLRKDNPGVDGSRFYNVPGMSHCGGGGLDRFDMLSALVDWVENGVAPSRIIATGPSFPGRSRPLCPAPQHAHYKGSGDPQNAANFECRSG